MPDAINCSPESNFTIIPNNLIKTQDLTCKAKVILFILLSNKDGWQSHVNSLLNMVKEGISTVQTGVKELEKNGYLKRVQYRDKKTKQKAGSFWAYSNIAYNLEFSRNVNMLHLSGYELYPEKLDVEKLHVEKLYVEKLPLIILKDNNTNNTNNIKKVNKKDFLKTFTNQLPETFTNDETFIESLNDFIQHRQNIKVPLTELAIKKLCNKFLKFTTQEIIDALDTSVESGKWPGVYPKSKKGFDKPVIRNGNYEPETKYRKYDRQV